MPKNSKEQLSFDQDIYLNPDSDILSSTLPEPSKPKKKAIKKPSGKPPATLQAFLPGLSRRGRPRSKNPVPATVRATESRKRRIEAGVKRIELLVAPEIAADLDLLAEHYRVSRIEIISKLIAKTAKRLRLPAKHATLSPDSAAPGR
ncbi:MAG: hypothetical protein AB1443_09790 [Pseudomonadota bacterium]